MFRYFVRKARSECRLRRSFPCHLSAIAGLVSALAISPALAQDGAAIAVNGTGGAPACSSCQGAHGEGQPENGFPRLAGLDAGYIVRQLESFADGSRKNDTMPAIAKALTPADRQAVATFYAGQQAAAPQQAATPGVKQAARGAELVVNGDWAQGVPGCGLCHGPSGQGVGSAFPRLAGQSAIYIENQFADWKAGKRSNDPLHLMSGIAKKLSDDDTKAVATYFASLKVVSKDNAHE